MNYPLPYASRMLLGINYPWDNWENRHTHHSVFCGKDEEPQLRKAERGMDEKQILNLFGFVLFFVVVVYFCKHSNHLYWWLLLWDKYTKKQQDSLASIICLVLTKYLPWKNYVYNIHKKKYNSHLVTFLGVHVSLEGDWNTNLSPEDTAKSTKMKAILFLSFYFNSVILCWGFCCSTRQGDFLMFSIGKYVYKMHLDVENIL